MTKGTVQVAGATGAAAAVPAVMAMAPLWSMQTRSMRSLVPSAAPWVTSVCAAKGKYSPTRACPAAMRVVSPETTDAAMPETTPLLACACRVKMSAA